MIQRELTTPLIVRHESTLPLSTRRAERSANAHQLGSGQAKPVNAVPPIAPPVGLALFLGEPR